MWIQYPLIWIKLYLESFQIFPIVVILLKFFCIFFIYQHFHIPHLFHNPLIPKHHICIAVFLYANGWKDSLFVNFLLLIMGSHEVKIAAVCVNKYLGYFQQPNELDILMREFCSFHSFCGSSMRNKKSMTTYFHFFILSSFCCYFHLNSSFVIPIFKKYFQTFLCTDIQWKKYRQLHYL